MRNRVLPKVHVRFFCWKGGHLLNLAKIKRSRYFDFTVDILGTLLIGFAFLFPFLWMVGMSFKDRMQTFAIPPLWFFYAHIQ